MLPEHVSKKFMPQTTESSLNFKHTQGGSAEQVEVERCHLFGTEVIPANSNYTGYS